MTNINKANILYRQFRIKFGQCMIHSSMSKGSDPGVDFSVNPIRDSCILYQHFRSIFTRCRRRFLMRRVIVVYPSFKGGNIWTLTSRSTHEQPSSQKQFVTSLPSSSSRSSFTDTSTVGSSAFGLANSIWPKLAQSYCACATEYTG
jgi:hypothetical protein